MVNMRRAASETSCPSLEILSIHLQSADINFLHPAAQTKYC